MTYKPDSVLRHALNLPLLVFYGVWVDPYKERSVADEVPGAEAAAALARHGAKANDLGAGLLVMGAYAHSRMREYIFGGATRHVLARANVPVLLSH